MTKNRCTEFNQNAERYSVKQELPALCRNDFADYKPVLGRQQFQEVKRHSFLKNSVIYTPAKITGLIDIISKRAGHGNYDIYRNNFLAPDSVGRVVDFDESSAIDLANFGQRVTLSDKTLDELSSVRIPDPGDKSWLIEKDRLTKKYKEEGNTDFEIAELLSKNLPLGREQRFMMTRANVNDSVLTMAQRLFELANSVKQGKFESKQSEAIGIVELSTIIDDDDAFNRLLPDEKSLIPAIANRLVKGFIDHRDFSLQSRYIDNDAYNSQSGLVKSYLMAKVKDNKNGLTDDKPVMGQKGDPMSIPSMKTSLGRSVNQNKLILDLEIPQMLTWNKILSIAEGFNNGLKNPAFDISPALIEEFQNRRDEFKGLSNIEIQQTLEMEQEEEEEEERKERKKEEEEEEIKERKARKKERKEKERQEKAKLLPQSGKKKKPP